MKKTSTMSETVYELKHRLAGAIILVVLAVVVIPLLLSEPGADASSKVSGNTQNVDEEGNIFVSRIVPLNIDNVNQVDNQDELSNDSEPTIIDDSKPALLDLTSSDIQSKNITENKSSEIVLTPETNTDVASIKSAEVVEKPETKSEVTIAATEQVTESMVLESGWIVRVGTFSKDANVQSVSNTLAQSGFTPKTTSVSTSLGNSTRVWLGPYAKRKTADKVSRRLEELVGEKGYVTRSAS